MDQSSLYDFFNMSKEEMVLKSGLKDIHEAIIMIHRSQDGSSDEDAIFALWGLRDTIEKLYRLQYFDGCQLVYEKYKEEFEKHTFLMILPSLQGKCDELLLRELVSRWGKYQEMVRLMSSSFDHLTCSYIIPNSLPTLNDLAIGCFREKVFLQIHATVIAAFLDFIHKHEGAQMDRSLLQQVIAIFDSVAVGVRDDLEKDMLAHMIAYYWNKMSKRVFEGSCPDFMLKLKDFLGRVRDVVPSYLPLTITEVQIYEIHCECHSFLRDGKVEDLSRIYILYHEVPQGLELIAKTFEQHLFAKGDALVQHAAQGTTSILQEGDAECKEVANGVTAKSTALVLHAEDAARNQVLVRELIKLHDEYKNHIVNYFNNDRIYRALQDAFRRLFHRWRSFALSLANFSDNMLKGGKLTLEEMEKTINTVVELIDCLSDKDQFSELYRQRLASRLLNQSTCPNYESTVISKMKQACGDNFTHKMEVMLEEMRDQPYTCNDKYVRAKSVDHIPLDVSVISPVNWPKFEEPFVNLPAEMERSAELFKEIYATETEHKKKKLEFLDSVGTCIIDAQFDGQDTELVVSVSQAALLMLFNNADRLSLSEIKTQLGITDDVLARLVSSMSCGEYNILNMEPSTRPGECNVVFFNSKFRTEKKRLELHFHKLIDEKVDEKKVIEKVDTERVDMIDAALVRVAKNQKFISHKDLIRKCVEQVQNFKPDISLIERRIDILVAHEYLKKQSGAPEFYIYIP